MIEITLKNASKAELAAVDYMASLEQPPMSREAFLAKQAGRLVEAWRASLRAANRDSVAGLSDDVAELDEAGRRKVAALVDELHGRAAKPVAVPTGK